MHSQTLCLFIFVASLVQGWINTMVADIAWAHGAASCARMLLLFGAFASERPDNPGICCVGYSGLRIGHTGIAAGCTHDWSQIWTTRIRVATETNKTICLRE